MRFVLELLAVVDSKEHYKKTIRFFIFGKKDDGLESRLVVKRVLLVELIFQIKGIIGSSGANVVHVVSVIAIKGTEIILYFKFYEEE